MFRFTQFCKICIIVELGREIRGLGNMLLHMFSLDTLVQSLLQIDEAHLGTRKYL